MALLAEYALTPDVFDTNSYSSAEVCNLHLLPMKDALLQEGLVRDLRDGQWGELFKKTQRPWHLRAKELLTKLGTQNRLVRHLAMNPALPASDVEWCEEALNSHGVTPLDGIIVTDTIAGNFKTQPLVATIGKLGSAPWWANRSPSLRLPRTLAGYRGALDLILRHANLLVFIDPHLDPTRSSYADLATLVQTAAGRSPVPTIEIHRLCYIGSGPSRQLLVDSELETMFGPFSKVMRAANLSVEVFVWDDFHDRYLISDLVGISLPNGFDTSSASNSQTTWTRLGRKDLDDVLREFDPASDRHKLKHRFHI